MFSFYQKNNQELLSIFVIREYEINIKAVNVERQNYPLSKLNQAE